MLQVLVAALAIAAGCSVCAADRGFAPLVEVEETVYTPAPADNGAGPMWCYGSTCLARVGDEVFASGVETIAGARPLNNVRWVLYRRGPDGWREVSRDPDGRTREPCPVAVGANGVLYLSANPAQTPPDAYNGPARPLVLEFDTRAPGAPRRTLEPVWQGAPAFTEHSYRGFSGDGAGGLLLFQNVGHEAAHWAYRSPAGKWAASGRLAFPMGVDYPTPEPIRLCYPVLALRGRAAHVMAISDIVEPIPEWRAFKLEINQGRAWDYDFRRLFYAWTPDITRAPFATPLEVASREKTAGQITNLDMHIDARGRARLLWLERSVWYPQMRDRFFPGTPLTTTLETCVLDRGRVVERTTLAVSGEGHTGPVPGYARFHAGKGGVLYVLAAFREPNGRLENRVLRLGRDGRVERSAVVPLKRPLSSFMTATVRAGSRPSDVLDVLGTPDGQPDIGYVRIRLR